MVLLQYHRNNIQGEIVEGSKVTNPWSKAMSIRFHENNNNKQDNPNDFFINLVDEICNDAMEKAEGNSQITRRNKALFPENTNRQISIVETYRDSETSKCTNRYVKLGGLHRSVSEKIITAHLPFVPEEIVLSDKSKNGKEPRKKKLSFNTFFNKKDKNKSKDCKTEETYDDFLHTIPEYKINPLGKTKKYASALELNQKSTKLQKTPSFIRKMLHMADESSFFKRSLSFRSNVGKKEKSNSRDSVSEMKNQEWKQSLQSLVESDVSVSYNDLSFIDYDALNQFSYDEPVKIQEKDDSNQVGRSQSMREKKSSQFMRKYQRHSSVISESRFSLGSNISESSNNDWPAISLPSLSSTNHRENEETLSRGSSSAIYHRSRPTSVSSEDDRHFENLRPNYGQNRLRRQNARREKSRHPVSFIESQRLQIAEDDQVIRSRSLNHLDSLEMRHSTVTATDSLKDSKSEPDCTKPLLPPPSSPPLTTVASGSQLAQGRKENEIELISAVSSEKKHVLSRSQKSSSECFSVNFEVGDESTWDNVLFFPAQRGISLLDSLSKLCELRNIDLSLCDAKLQDKDTSLESFVSFSHDTANLVGRHLRIIAKDLSDKKSYPVISNHSRKPSGSYRPRTSSFFSSSTEDQNISSSTLCLHENDQNKRQIKQRLTAFFGNSKDTKYEVVIEHLDRYSRHGVPQNVTYPQGQCESIDALYKLEEDWREIIENFGDLTEKQQQQQIALWELIKTEVAYIRTLKTVTDLFLGCLKDLQSKNIFKEIDTEKLFSNITEILDANVIFWRNTLFPLVRDMRKYRRPPCMENMLEGFSKIHDIFQPYYKYCAEQSRCQHYCRENMESDVFTAYLTWCESQKDCNRLRLMDILVQPMQRLTKYGLLLKAILKNTEEDVERESLQAMIKLVDEFVNNVNSSLKYRQDKERLKGIIARIESYDVVESKDDDIEKILKKDKSLTQLDLTKPMLGCPVERKRHLLLEGDLKLKDQSTSKVEVHCFLLTDMLLICKPSTKKGAATMRVIRQPYIIDRLIVQDLNRETPSLAVIYKNEFDMAIAAFILQSNDVKKIKGWKEGISKAQLLYAQAKQINYTDETVDAECSLMDSNLEAEFHTLQQLVPRSPLVSSSRTSRVSSLAHSHSGSVEMNDQSSIDHSRGVSVENENRTGSMSSDEGAQPLPSDQSKSPVTQKTVLKNRLFNKTPNTLMVQPYASNLGQSLPNLTLGSPNVGALNLNLNQNTLSVPGNKNSSSHLLSPTHRGISYPPPSPTRGNLRRSLAISQGKNPPLIKTRQVNSASGSMASTSQVPASIDFDVPVIAGIIGSIDNGSNFCKPQHEQKRTTNHTTTIIDENKRNDSKDGSIHRRLSWNLTNRNQWQPINKDQQT